MYRLKLLGVARLEGPSGTLSGRAVQRRRLALLAILGADRTGGITRERLVALLWPDVEEGQARHYLSQSLYTLRQEMGEDAILSMGELLQLNPEVVYTDTRAFHDALKTKALEQAVSLYGGPLLEGFHLPGSREFDEWSDTRGRELASEYARALEQLALGCEKDADHRKSAEWWERLAAHDPYNSRAVVGLMQALAAAGDPANAVKVAAEHEHRLKEEFGMEPAPEVAALVARLRKPSLEKPVVGVPEPGVSAADELQGLTHAPELVHATPKPGSRKSARALIIAGLTAAALLVVLYNALTIRRSAPALVPNAVMVTRFENLTGEPELDRLGRFATFAIEGALSGVDAVRVVSSADAEAVRKVIQEVDALAGVALTRAMARYTRAGLVLEGSYYGRGDSILFEARLVDAATAEVLGAVETSADRADPADGVEALEERVLVSVATRLKLGDQYAESYGRGRSYEAWQELDAARQLIREDRWREALGLVYRALEIDPTFDAAAGLAMIWHMNLGEFSRADSLARVLEERLARLPARQRWQLAVTQAVLRRDRSRLLQAFREWRDRLPSLSSYYHLAWGASVAQRPGECLEALEAVDRDSRRYAPWAYFWSVYADCHHSVGQFREGLEEALEGLERFPNSPLLVFEEVRAFAALNRADEARRLLEEHYPQTATHEPYQEEATFTILVESALELRAHGHGYVAAEILERSVEWYQDTTAAGRVSAARQWHLARALYAAERWEEAQEAFATLSPEDLTDNELLLHHNIDVSLLGYRATLAARLGDVETAERIDRELGGMQRPWLWGHAVYWRAALASVRGEREKATELLKEAIADGLFAEQWGAEYPKWDYHIDPDFESLREYHPFQEVVAPRG